MKSIFVSAGLALLLQSANPVTASVAPRDVTDAVICGSCHGYPPAQRTVAAPFSGADRADAGFEDYPGGGGAYLLEGHIPTIPSQGWANCIGCHNGGEEALRALPTENELEEVEVAVDLDGRSAIEDLAACSSATLISGRTNRTGTCFDVSCHFRPTAKWSLTTSR